MIFYYYPAFVVFEQANCIDWIIFSLYTFTDRKFSGTPVTYILPVEVWEPSCISSTLPVDRKYQKGQSRDIFIILLFNSIWIHVIFSAR